MNEKWTPELFKEWEKRAQNILDSEKDLSNRYYFIGTEFKGRRFWTVEEGKKALVKKFVKDL